MTPGRLFLTAAFLAAYHFAFSQFWSSLGTGIPAKHVALGDAFGTSISIDGNVAIIGAPGNDDHHSNAGKAFIYEKIGSSWAKQVELFPSHPYENINFGFSVLVSGDYVFVGAPGLSTGATAGGGVYIFKKELGSWQSYTEVDVISAEDFNENANFGTSIAKYGNVLAVGAPQANGATANSGAVYIFEFDGMNFQFSKKVNLKTGAGSERFGQAIALNDSNLFVGSPFRDPIHNYGAVFVFDRITYDSVATLSINSDTFSFGSSISVTNNAALISAQYLLNDNGSYGAVCLFQKGAGWSSRYEDLRFTPQDPAQDYGLYGYALALTDSIMVIGSRSGTKVDVIKNSDTGWGAATRIKTFQEPGLTHQSQYGDAIAVSATDLLIGASNLTRPEEGNGIVFAYEANLDWNTPTKLPDLSGMSSNAGGDFFGGDVDISGNYAVVGAMKYGVQAENAGAAYVYQLNGTAWNLVAKLTASDAAEQNYFGQSVSITADRIVISAPYAAFNGTSSGVVYVFEKPAAGWTDMTESATINRVNPAKSGRFGLQVAAFGQEIALTHYNNSGTGYVGEAYVFVKSGNGWQLEGRLNVQDQTNAQGDGFGMSLAFNGNTVVVGAPLAFGLRQGLAYVFEKPTPGWSNMTQTAILSPSDPATFGAFGSSVDIDQTTIIVGRPGGYNAAQGAGYIFEKGSQWQNSTEDAILRSSVTTSGIGTGVAIAGDYAVVSTANNNGHVFLFRKQDGQWKNETQYNDLFPGTIPSQFGFEISLSGDNLIVGDPIASTNSGGGTGMVSFFIKDPTVLKVTSSTPDGTYGVTQNINVKVVFSHKVVVTGNPSIDLTMYDSNLRSGTFAGTGTNGEVNFTYTVLENDSTPHLNYANPLSLKGTFTIASAVTSQPAITTLPSPDSPLSLAGQKNIVIDGILQIVPVTGLDPKQNISVYPNPFEDQLMVTGENIRSYKIIDCTGATVQSRSFSQGAIDTSQLTNGFYVLQIKTRDGIVRAKIIRR